MEIKNKTLKNANITIVANKLHTSFISPLFFDFLPSPQNVVQIPNFGLMDFVNCNFIIDVDNKRVLINDIIGRINESPIPKMAQKFINDIKGTELVAMGFNYILDITCDAEFGNFSIEEFLPEKYKKIFRNELLGTGIKVFIKKPQYNITFSIEPVISEPLHALINANFHYEEFPSNLENEFIDRYNEFEVYTNGIFS